jgi:DNA processing protein
MNEHAMRAYLTHITEPADTFVGGLLDNQAPVFEILETLAGGSHRLEDVVLIQPGGKEKYKPRMTLGLDEKKIDAWYTEQLTRHGLSFVIPGDDDWPEGLDDLFDETPAGLWVRGDRSTLHFLNTGASVAMVGARAATSYGEHVAMELSSALVQTGAPIVSGAAYGIDGAAHRAALAAGGTTIAFLAGGVDRPYPAGHRELIDRIVRDGAVVSEVPPGSAPTKWRFLARNRLIAAASRAMVVVEAGWRSGSLNAAAHAKNLGRPVMAVPGPITSAASAGCHRLIREGIATLVTSADEVAQRILEEEQ